MAAGTCCCDAAVATPTPEDTSNDGATTPATSAPTANSSLAFRTSISIPLPDPARPVLVNMVAMTVEASVGTSPERIPISWGEPSSPPSAKIAKPSTAFPDGCRANLE
jgi:hypothetical protein